MREKSVMKLRAAVVCKGLHSAYLAGDVGYADFHVGCVMSRMADGEPVTEIASPFQRF